MTKNRTKKKETPTLHFDQKLVLNQWMLSLFNVDSCEKVSKVPHGLVAFSGINCMTGNHEIADNCEHCGKSRLRELQP